MSFQTFQQDLVVGIECLHEPIQDFDVERWYDDPTVSLPGRTCSQIRVSVLQCLLLRLLHVTFTQNYRRYCWFRMCATHPGYLKHLHLITQLEVAELEFVHP